MSARPLSEVILDMQRVYDCRKDAFDALETAQREHDEFIEKQRDEEVSALEAELDDLREEFRSSFKTMTRVAWANIESMQMSGAL